MKGKTEKPTIIVGDFNMSLSIIYRLSRQKKKKKTNDIDEQHWVNSI